jgi:filamentous hemagglutinin family protein
MRKIKPDVPGIIAGTILTGGATIWLLNDNGVVQTDDVGLTAALLLVTAGIIGLAASHRG